MCVSMGVCIQIECGLRTLKGDRYASKGDLGFTRQPCGSRRAWVREVIETRCVELLVAGTHDFAFTRYCFTSKQDCGSPSSFYPPHPSPAKPTLLQYYCMTFAQYTPPLLCHTP